MSSTEQVTELTPLSTGEPAGGSTDRPGVTVAPERRRLQVLPRELAELSAHAPIGEQLFLPPRRDATLRRMLAAADVVAAAGALLVIDPLIGRGFGVTGLVALPLIVLLAKLMGRYDHDDMMLRRSTLDEVPQLLGLAAIWSLAWSLISLVDVRLKLAGGGIGVMWLACGTLLVGGRSLARLLAKVLTPRERVLIVGDAQARERLASSLCTDPGAQIEIVGFLPLEDERRGERRSVQAGRWPAAGRRRRHRSFDDLARVVTELKVNRVFLIPTSADSETMLQAVNRTTSLGINVSIVPRLFEVVGSAVEFDTVGGVTVLGVRRVGLSRSSARVKRVTDALGACAGLVLLAPMFALAAIAIKLDSSGPVFFRQARVGRDGRPFGMFKFRSMIDGAEAQRAALEALNETDGLFKVRDDPRITRVGHLLRRASIDELPQLINVLLGDMSLVGPRPLVLDEDRLVEGRHRDRLRLAPGMTGPWQVLGPARPPLSEMVKTDYLYAANWSLWTDIKIVLRTFAHVFARRGL